jgi:hypothetical protein
MKASWSGMYDDFVPARVRSSADAMARVLH